ncbi:MAG TPA: hypothetical protein VG737_07855, partial [Cyclobacteriaceae bacterium]|nr:hypothetical protein [Cyclobacteriaceae bacterium]
MAILLLVFIPENGKKLVTVFCWATLALSLWAVTNLPGSFKPAERIYTLSIFPIKSGEIKTYFADLVHYKIVPGPNPTPAALTGTVDVVPAEISEVYRYNLQYNPRPIIQSYSAYSGYLDSLNQNKYLSDTKPDHLLLSYGSIDDRYPFFDETRTKLAILSQYKITGEFNGQLIMGKADSPLRAERIKTTRSEAKLGESIQVPGGVALQFAKVDVKYSLWGKIRRLLFRPPGLTVKFTLSNGDTYSYKAITSILSGGVIINRFVDTQEELEFFLRCRGELNTRVKKIEFDPTDGDNGFDENITITTDFLSFNAEGGNQSKEDSAAIEAVYAANAPKNSGPATIKGDSIRLWVESLNTHSKFIHVGGWAFDARQDNRALQATILLRSVRDTFAIKTTPRERPDLSNFFHRKDLDNSGFVASVTKSLLPPGAYIVGVLLENPATGSRLATYSDKEIIVRRQPAIEQIERVAPSNATEQLFSLEQVDEDDEQVFLSGWAAVKGYDSKKITTNIILISENISYRISTERISRPDVATHFNNPLFLASGFSVFFPKEKIQKGSYKIAIEDILDGKISVVSVTDRILKSQIDDYVVPRPAEVPPVGMIDKGIDEFRDNGPYCTIAGWAAPKDSDFTGYQIQIILQSDHGGYICDAESRLRKDVTEALNNGHKLDSCGFYLKIKKDDLPKGEYKIGIYLHKRNEPG